MPKRAKEKTAAQIRQLTKPGVYAVGGVSGLVVQVKDSGAKSWLLRTMVAGRRRAIGLGAFPDVSLSQARDDARTMKRRIRDGADPIDERQESRQALAAARAAQITFDECARQCHASKSQEFRNAKHAAQWANTLNTYASPVIGSLPIDEVEVGHVVRILEALWAEKTETAVRLRGRMEAVFAWAIARGYRKGDNPARWKGHLDAILPAPTKITKVQHFRAVPVDQVAKFMAQLRERQGTGARALDFTILTAARSGEVRGATWNEIDFQARTWTVPGDRMKAGRPHTVPLSQDAVRLLEALHRRPDTDLVFPSTQGRALSDATLSAVVKRLGWDATVHGFRSTFADWAAERTAYAAEVREAALAHVVENKTERAYRRGELLEKRRRLMQDWARVLATVDPAGDVTPMRAAQ